jgi:hypothetical protein
MTLLVPCMRCNLRKDCAIRSEKLALLRPAKVASVRWRCSERLAAFPVGSRVSTPATWFELQDGGYDGPWHSESTEIESATVVSHPREMHGRVLVRLDREISGIKGPVQFVKRWPDQLTRIEGSVPVCATCGRPETAHGYECFVDDATGPEISVLRSEDTP